MQAIKGFFNKLLKKQGINLSVDQVISKVMALKGADGNINVAAIMNLLGPLKNSIPNGANLMNKFKQETEGKETIKDTEAENFFRTNMQMDADLPAQPAADTAAASAEPAPAAPVTASS